MATAEIDALRWRGSSFCNGGNCVEIAFHGDVVAVRNSEDPGTCLAFPATSWRSFVDGVKGDSLGCES